MTNGYHEPTKRMLDVDVLYHLKHYSELQSSHERRFSCRVQGLAAKVTVTLPLHVVCEKGCKGAQINQKTWAPGNLVMKWITLGLGVYPANRINKFEKK